MNPIEALYALQEAEVGDRPPRRRRGMGKRRTRLIIITGFGVALVAVGAGFIYWPAALIVGGVALMVVGVLSDDGED